MDERKRISSNHVETEDQRWPLLPPSMRSAAYESYRAKTISITKGISAQSSAVAGDSRYNVWKSSVRPSVEMFVIHSPDSPRYRPSLDIAPLSTLYETDNFSADTESVQQAPMSQRDCLDAAQHELQEAFANAGLDMRLMNFQSTLFAYSPEENERLTRNAFENSGGLSTTERSVEKMQRIVQRLGMDSNRFVGDANETLHNVYTLRDLYKLATMDEVVAFATMELDWFEAQLLAKLGDILLLRTVRTPEFFEADSLAFSTFRRKESARSKLHRRPFHKVYCVVADVMKVVEAVELICMRWNKPHAQVCSVEDFLVGEQDFSQRLKVVATVEFFGIAWKLHFTTRHLWELEKEEGGRLAKKTLDFLQIQFLVAAIQNKPDKIRNFVDCSLFKSVADPNIARDASGLSGLHHAAIQGSMKMTVLLIRAQANPWSQDNHFRPPLYYALRFGRREVAKYLMELMEEDKDCESNLTAICSCLEFGWDDHFPLIPSVVRMKRHIKARYIELLREERFSEFGQLAKFTKVTIEDPTVLRLVFPHSSAAAGALLQALVSDATVNLDHLNLSAQKVMELADALKLETFIGKLNFRGNKELGVDVNAGIGIARILSMAPHLRVLVLDDCGFTPETFHSLVTRLDQTRGGLHVISLKNNRFLGDDTGSGVALHSLLRIRSLRQIDSSLCGWCARASAALCRRLQSHFHLRRLNLDNNPYIGSDPEFGETLAKILIFGRALDFVSLAGCDISSEVITLMGRTISEYPNTSPQVRSINFQKNIRLGNRFEAGHGLAVLLHRCEALASINLSFVGMTPKTILSFGKTLHVLRAKSARKKADNSTAINLRECSVSSMNLENNYKLGGGPESGLGLAYLLVNCTQLLDLNLTGCHLSPQALHKLGESLDRVVSVRSIRWEGNWHIGSAPEGGRGLGLLLQRAHSLREIDFTHCGLASDSLGALGEALHGNVDLMKITIDSNNVVGMKRAGGKGLGKLLLNARSLERFNFTNCKVTAAFVDGLRDVLTTNSEQTPIVTCKFITIQLTPVGGPISSVGEMLANLLMAARFLYSCEFERCQLDSVSMAKLGQSVTRNIAVKKILFSKNDAIGAYPSGGTGIGQLMCKTAHLEEISLKQTGISSDATAALGEALTENAHSLKVVDLSNNPRLGSGSNAGQGIASILRCCPQLELLNLAFCNFGSDAINRCSSILSNESLGVKRLNFHGNVELAQLVDSGASLGFFLSAAHNLEWLNLCRCGLNAVAITSMVNHARSFNALTFLDISESYVASSKNDAQSSRREAFAPGGAPIARFVNLGPRIKVLRVSECGILPSEMLEFGKVLKPNELEDVDFSGNYELGDSADGGMGLGLFLHSSQKLRVLNLKHCGISVAALRAMLRTRGFKDMPCLTTLLLTSNPLGGSDESGMLLGDLLGRCCKLGVLEIRNCGLTSSALGDLGPAISRRGDDIHRADRERTQLRVLDLAYNVNVGDSANSGKGLAGLINSCPTIFEINLTCCGLTSTALSILLENLNEHRSKTIKKMLFSGNEALFSSHESGRILFQLLLKFRLAYIDCSSCGITSAAAESLGGAIDAWHSGTLKEHKLESKRPRPHNSQIQSTDSSRSIAHISYLRQSRTIPSRDKSALRYSASVTSQTENRITTSRFIRNMMMDPKLYVTVHEMDFSNNPDMLSTGLAGQGIAKLLTLAETIELLRLSNCGVDSDAIASMAEYVEQMHIINLDLSRNRSIATHQVGADGLQTMFSNPKIEEIDLSDCCIPIKFAPTVS